MQKKVSLKKFNTHTGKKTQHKKKKKASARATI